MVSAVNHVKSARDFRLGRDINHSNYDIMSHGAIGTLERMVNSMPAPKKKKGKKKKAAEDPTDEPPSPDGKAKKKKKKKKAKKSTIPEAPLIKYGEV